MSDAIQTPPPAPVPAAPVAWFRRRWWKLPVWGWLTIVLVLVAAGVSGGKKDDADDAAATTASTVAPSDVQSTGTEAVTTTTSPTTDAPTTTAAPTTTRATTTTASTLPPTTLPPQPVVFTGRGDDVVELPNTDVMVATITHNGRSNFAIWALDAGLTETQLLVNTIGSYSGRVPVNLTDETSALQITADGDWTISLLPLVDDVRRVLTDTSGVGDDVLFLEETGVYSIAHTGESNFAVWVYSTDDTDLAVNEIGDYSGNVPLSGPAFVVINADGQWTITKG